MEAYEETFKDIFLKKADNNLPDNRMTTISFLSRTHVGVIKNVGFNEYKLGIVC